MATISLNRLVNSLTYKNYIISLVANILLAVLGSSVMHGFKFSLALLIQWFSTFDFLYLSSFVPQTFGASFREVL